MKTTAEPARLQPISWSSHVFARGFWLCPRTSAQGDTKDLDWGNSKTKTYYIYIYVPLDPPKLKMLKQQSSAILGRGILSEWKP